MTFVDIDDITRSWDPSTGRTMMQNRKAGVSSWVLGDRIQDAFDIAELQCVRIATHDEHHDLRVVNSHTQGFFTCELCRRSRGGRRWHCEACVLDFCFTCVENSLNTETRMSVSQKNRELSGGWKTSFDISSRRYYYYNEITGERSWYKPRFTQLERTFGEDDNEDMGDPTTSRSVHDLSGQKKWVTFATASASTSAAAAAPAPSNDRPVAGDIAATQSFGMRSWQRNQEHKVVKAQKSMELDAEFTRLQYTPKSAAAAAKRTPRNQAMRRQQINKLLDALGAMETVGYTCRGSTAEKGHEAFRRFHEALMEVTCGTYALPPEVWDTPALCSHSAEICQLMHEVRDWRFCRVTDIMFVDVLMTMTATPQWHETVQVQAKKLPPETYDFLEALGKTHNEWYIRLKGNDNFTYSMGTLVLADKRRDEMIKEAEEAWAAEAEAEAEDIVLKSLRRASTTEQHQGHSDENTPHTISTEGAKSKPPPQKPASKSRWPTYKFRSSSREPDLAVPALEDRRNSVASLEASPPPNSAGVQQTFPPEENRTSEEAPVSAAKNAGNFSAPPEPVSTAQQEGNASAPPEAPVSAVEHEGNVSAPSKQGDLIRKPSVHSSARRLEESVNHWHLEHTTALDALAEEEEKAAKEAEAVRQATASTQDCVVQ
mmetsp:Transcript_7055/g.15440  ORF Transcript_7055/g.15440 Transcript_7055/m.15440 type:complete len:657 (-) Transcript_7055:126-2096(-)